MSPRLRIHSVIFSGLKRSKNHTQSQQVYELPSGDSPSLITLWKPRRSSLQLDIALSNSDLYIDLYHEGSPPQIPHAPSAFSPTSHLLPYDSIPAPITAPAQVTEHLVSHPLLSDVLSALDKYGIALLIGPAGAGKSTLARQVCEEIRGKNSVVWLPPNNLVPELLPSILREISRLTSDDVLLVDDIHRSPRLLNAVYLAARARQVHLLLTTRPNYHSEVFRHDPIQIAEIESSLPQATFYISASAIAEAIISLYESQRDERWSEDLKADILQHSHSNLWMLTCHLKHVKGAVLDPVALAHDIIAEVTAEAGNMPQALEVYFVVSLLYQYEIPVPIRFLVQSCHFSLDLIERLIARNVLQYSQVTNCVFMAHSSQARLFSRVSFSVGITSEVVNSESNRERATAEALATLLEFNPRVVFSVVQRTRYDAQLLHTCSQNNRFMGVIKNTLNAPSSSTLDLAHLLSDFTRVTDSTTRSSIVSCIDMDKAVEKLNSEENLHAIAGYLDGFPWIVPSTAIPLVEHVNKDIRARAHTLNNDATNAIVGICAWMVPLNNPNSLVSALNQLYEKYSSGTLMHVTETNRHQVGFCSKNSASNQLHVCGKSFFSAPNPTSKSIVTRLDISSLTAKIDASTSLYAVSHLMDLLLWIDKKTVVSVFESVDHNHLLRLTNGEANVKVSCFFAWVAGRIDKTLYHSIYHQLLHPDVKALVEAEGWVA